MRISDWSSDVCSSDLTRGARLASFFWVQSLIRNDAQRRMLFELDASIQALTQSGADRAALLQLTGIYHNLLRLWAETCPTPHHDLPPRHLPAALVLPHHRRHRARHPPRPPPPTQLPGRTAEGTKPRGHAGP